MYIAVITGATGLILGLFLGWSLRDIRQLLIKLLTKVDDIKVLTKEPEKPEKPKGASFAEPMTPVELAALEERERIARLNGEL